MINKKILYTILISILIISSCRNNTSNEILEFPENSKIANDLNSNEAKVYSLPSPYQVSALIKLTGIKYQSNIVDLPRKQKASYASPEYKSMNLGISLVNLYYCSVYEQYTNSIVFLKKVDSFMYELGLKNQNTDNLKSRVEKNYTNKDSLKSYMRIYQKDFEKYYSSSEEKQKTFLIVGGIYIEGIYTLTEIYKGSFEAQNLTKFMEKSFNGAVLQQSIFLDNLIEILEAYNDTRLEKIILRFKDLQKLFAEINIKYEIGEKNEIKEVKLKMKNILEINAMVKKIREEIILEKI
jgi:hypothetical protein